MTTKSELLQLAERITEMAIQLQAGIDRLSVTPPDGRAVGRWYIWDTANNCHIAGVVYDNREKAYTWTNTGRYDIHNQNHPFDIHNVTEDK